MRPENSGPLRKVVRYESGYRRQIKWVLECGHGVFHKTSVPIAKAAHCRECGTDARKG